MRRWMELSRIMKDELLEAAGDAQRAPREGFRGRFHKVFQQNKGFFQ